MEDGAGCVGECSVTAEAVPQVRGLSEAERKGKTTASALGDEDGAAAWPWRWRRVTGHGVLDLVVGVVWDADPGDCEVIYGAHYTEYRESFISKEAGGVCTGHSSSRL